MLGPTPVAEPQTISVPAGGNPSVTFRGREADDGGVAKLAVAIDGAAPFETDDKNNSRRTKVEVTERELRAVERPRPVAGRLRRAVQQPRLRPDHAWPAGTGYGDFEAKAKALQPHIVRIFYNDNWDGNRDGRFPNWPRTTRRS